MSKIIQTDQLQLLKKDNTIESKMSSCGWRLIALLLLYILYLLLGAAVFSAIEGPLESELHADLATMKASFLEQHPCIQEERLDELLDLVVYSSKRGVYSPTKSVEGTESLDRAPNWSFGQSFFFAATVITTIGYGEQTPLSGKGKMFCIGYCVVGIPLTLLLLSSIVQRLLDPANLVLMWLNGRLGNLYQPLVIRLLHLIMVFLLICTAFLVIPSFILSHLEPDWNWFDSFYYCFISLTTVGLGDFIPGDTLAQPHRPFYKVAITVYLLLGLVGMMLLMTIFTSIPELDVTVWFLPSLQYQDDPERQRLHEAGSGGPMYTQQDNETLRVVRARSRRDDEAEWDESSTKSQYGDTTPSQN